MTRRREGRACRDRRDRRDRRLSPWEAAFLAVFVVGMILYGGSKRPDVTWDDVLADAGSSIDTNDLRRVTFAWTVAPYVPASAEVVFYSLWRWTDGGATNSLGRVAATNGTYTCVLPDAATNYLYYAECDWTPAPSVVTNGVYHIRARVPDGTERIVPLGVRTYENGRGVLPPEEENGRAVAPRPPPGGER